jgi:hypothetical protein
MPDTSRVWTMTYCDGLWSFRTPPFQNRAGFKSLEYRTRREALEVMLERFNARPAIYRFVVERNGRTIVRLIKRRLQP